MRHSGNLDANKDRDDGNLISFHGNRCSTRSPNYIRIYNSEGTTNDAGRDINLRKDAGSVQFGAIVVNGKWVRFSFSDKTARVRNNPGYDRPILAHFRCSYHVQIIVRSVSIPFSSRLSGGSHHHQMVCSISVSLCGCEAHCRSIA